MPLLIQHILVLSLVAACVAYVGWQALRALRGTRSKIGSCCAIGCREAHPTGAGKRATERIVFIPVESLARRK